LYIPLIMNSSTINSVYKKITSKGYLGSVRSLSKICGIKESEAQRYLRTQNSYTRHKARRTKFRRRRVVSPGMNYLWQADVVFLPKYKNENDGFSCLLTVIDVFSKFAYAIPMKSKSSIAVIAAFSKILSSTKHRPKTLECDQGTEFWSKMFQKWINQQGILMYHNYSDFGSSVVERFNRSICTIISKHLTLTGQKRYIDDLPHLVRLYNQRVHSRTKYAPSKVNKYNEMDVWLESYKDLYSQPIPKPSLKLYDRVRLDKTRGLFEKGYWPAYTSEIFEICEVISSVPVTYRVRDMKGEIISGIFYSQDLSKVEV